MLSDLLVARTPKTLWIELTSKCPFDCVFCSRKSLRGAGEHMDIALYRRILEQLDRPVLIRLNYSGESIHHPHLADAIRLAKQTGAAVELVSAFASASTDLIRSIVDAGLDRLSISLHTFDEAQFRDIYRFSTLAALKRNIQTLLAHRKVLPVVDFAFVAMESNLAQLPLLARYAADLGITDISVHPVIQRDPLPLPFNREQSPAFIARVEQTAAQAREFAAITIARPLEPDTGYGPGISTCEQNPWETIHILANGDAVVCEVQDHTAMGNVGLQSLDEVWQGTAYRQFRERYLSGTAEACRSCVWRKSVAITRDAVSPEDRESAQLVRGWYTSAPEPVLWSRSDSVLVLRRSERQDVLRLRGLLPAGKLEVRCDGLKVHEISNPGGFEIAAPLRPATNGTAIIEFRSTETICPARSGDADARELGFAIASAGLETAASTWTSRALLKLIQAADFIPPLRKKRITAAPAGDEIAIIIPARGNPQMLNECLNALDGRYPAIVVVNGSSTEAFAEVRRRFQWVRFIFHQRPLGFSRAIAAGLAEVSAPWTYLLNSDMVLEPDAIQKVAELRAVDVFAIGSRIALRDGSSAETNWTAMHFDQGLVELEELDPACAVGPQSNLYCGGGSSLFQTVVLRCLVRQSFAYDPFYWEDVEWGTRARGLGYRNLFCPESFAHHRHRATVGAYYEPPEVARIFERNRLLYQLRNKQEGGNDCILAARITALDRRTKIDLALRLPYSLYSRERWRLVEPEVPPHRPPEPSRSPSREGTSPVS